MYHVVAEVLFCGYVVISACPFITYKLSYSPFHWDQLSSQQRLTILLNIVAYCTLVPIRANAINAVKTYIKDDKCKYSLS